ncbi:hypothetical protein vseg_003269 [Gypsophila vaccaria]
MVRAPCCEKMGLKKGPWTPEEDQILINYIRLHGHNNWRALPKQAGLLRCGKSCRLRWTNYLRPDIKRGNFTQEEEETIIKLHELLGNRWSAIAARLPGRTDNEIKNVWHTHLKKKLPPPNPGSTTATAISAAANNMAAGPTRKRSRKGNESKRNGVPKKRASTPHEKSMEPNNNDDKSSDTIANTMPITSIKIEPCTSDVSTVTSTSTSTSTNNETDTTHGEKDPTRVETKGGGQDYLGDLPDINDDFWMEVLSIEDTAMSTEDLPCISQLEDQVLGMDPVFDTNVNSQDMDAFWHNLLTKSHDLPEIIEML